MEASATSLHARPIEDAGGRLGFVGACLVSQPGLPLYRRAAALSGQPGRVVTVLDDGVLTVYQAHTGVM
jgi:hypothetical protein